MEIISAAAHPIAMASRLGIAALAISSSTVLLVTPDAMLRERLRTQLIEMRWIVLEAGGGAEALMLLETHRPVAALLDSWLPDLEAVEFARVLGLQHPAMDLIHLDGTPSTGAARALRRQELLHALREVGEAGRSDGAAWLVAPSSNRHAGASSRLPIKQDAQNAMYPVPPPVTFTPSLNTSRIGTADAVDDLPPSGMLPIFALPEMVGDAPAMRELARMVRLVAPRNATVLIEGETGSGKELVARAVHRLSERAGKPFVVLNCAAIPEQLLEAELFGHTRGAFTGAVTSRTGRIEAAHGGTLFLDEIGEMPLALQAKMLRFLECGELQRLGDNDISRVDVRVVAATHQPLEERSADGTFRLDLYHRLAVFPIEVPALRDRPEDLSMLVHHLLRSLGETMPKRHISPDALALLYEHRWPGNVRELMHVLERAAILTGDRSEIRPAEIRLRRAPRSI